MKKSFFRDLHIMFSGRNGKIRSLKTLAVSGFQQDLPSERNVSCKGTVI
ncbi:hypothetical protein BAXH7_01540 [Bacillus amyloliquefaciens XH7]|nr:hypothetical protein LL3_02089 [Bacillus amyloliquefaciens LL3]AEK88678.1 hypothetical protein BAXH7_01540 [Bacillus amyloliquefaciens XH7]